MPVCGIITEYNPFHNGHVHHLKECKKYGQKAVCVMSGNFTQRGEPAIADKWQRAAWALKGGADLVIELPFVYATGSAEIFAQGATRLLGALNIVDELCFGAEIPLENLFSKAAAMQLSPAYGERLKKELKKGVAYHKAAACALGALGDSFKSPNNILGLEYAKAILQYKLNISLRPIQRTGADYHDKTIDSAVASASAIRAALQDGDFVKVQSAVPDFVAENLKEIQRPANIEDLATAILTLLRLSEPRRLAQIDNISEGLENKILHSAAASFSIAELIGSIKSARYPYSRLQRIMLHILFNVTKDDMAAFIKEGPQYIRVLGFNKNGQSLLRKLKGSARLPVIVKTAQYLNSKARCNKSSLLEKMLAYDTLATDIYSLLENKPSGGDFTRGAVRLD